MGHSFEKSLQRCRFKGKCAWNVQEVKRRALERAAGKLQALALSAGGAAPLRLMNCIVGQLVRISRRLNNQAGSVRTVTPTSMSVCVVSQCEPTASLKPASDRNRSVGVLHGEWLHLVYTWGQRGVGFKLSPCPVDSLRLCLIAVTFLSVLKTWTSCNYIMWMQHDGHVLLDVQRIGPSWRGGHECLFW